MSKIMYRTGPVMILTREKLVIYIPYVNFLFLNLAFLLRVCKI